MVSIIVPLYNQAEYLPETLDSVLKQTTADWECIIVNDGSLDNAEEVAKQYVERDSRIKYYYKENGGLSDARNYGIAKSSGEYILPLDADDMIAPSYVQKAASVLDNNSSVKVVYCIAELFGEQSGVWDLPPYSFEGLLYNNMIFCTAMYRRSDYLQTDGYSLEMSALEDWDFWLTLLEKGGDVYQIPEVCFLYRIRLGSMVRSVDKELNNSLKMKIYIRHLNTYIKYWGYPFELIEYKEKYLSLIEGRNYKLMKKLYAPVKNMRALLKI